MQLDTHHKNRSFPPALSIQVNTGNIAYSDSGRYFKYCSGVPLAGSGTVTRRTPRPTLRL
jgi:hypothetical protein